MEHKLATDEIKEQAALYALGALSQFEARAFENHLADGCEVCQAEMAEFEGVVGVLGLAAPAAVPPAYLRDLLTARIGKEPRITGSPQNSRIRGGLAARPRVERRSPWTTALPWAVAACLAIVAVSSLLSLRRAINTSQIAEREVVLANDSVRQMNDLLASAMMRQTEQAQIIEALGTPGSSHIVLAVQKDAVPSIASVYWNKRNRKWLVVADLRPAPPGKVYQLWFVTKTAPVSAGLIRTDSNGHAFSVVSIPPDVDQIDAAAITLEPEGGSATPTMPILALGKVE